MTANLNCLGSICEEVEYPVPECSNQAQSAISFMGEILLNAELKSTKSTLVFLFLKCLKTEGRAVEMASSVALLALNANW